MIHLKEGESLDPGHWEVSHIYKVAIFRKTEG